MFDAPENLCAKADTELTIRQLLAKDIRGRCGRCGQPGAGVFICARCTAYLSELWPHRVKTKAAGRICPDCATPLYGRQRYCQDCAQRHLKEARREAVRRHRLKVSPAVIS
jgi:hypothetical protein